ncbi:GNAT family N-acetyltransferase [Coprobacter fastidiosus]|uniref:GNAT family N-acetyltransferase n=1 Tax=Coprobacter fastidiosus TaxID=1099853 RepID=UPI003AB31F57
MMTIRLAKENDIEEIMGLITRTVISGQSSSGWNETYPTKEIFVKDIDNQYLYVYEDNHIVIGIISLIPGPDPDYQSIIWKNSGTSPLVLHRLCVDPHRQREGIGSRLMNFAETFGREQGYTSLQLDTRISNHTAANLYEQLGYTKTGTITRNRGNFICYEKKL